MPIWAGVAISAGVGLYGAKKQSDASKQAAQTQTAASNQALGLQSQIYNQTRNDLAPYRGAGTAALGSEMSLLGLNPAAMGSLGGGPSMVGMDGTAGGGPSYGLTGPAAPPGFKAGAIGDPNANGGYGGQSHGTDTLGSSSDVNDTTSSYGPKTNPVPVLKFQHSDGTVYQIPADQVADAQKQDPGGKVLGPVNG